MSDHLLHLTSIYKMGHQRFTCSVAVIGRNINRIESVPPEVPEYADGFLTRVQLAHGEFVNVTEPFEKVNEMWAAASLASLD